MIRLSDAIAAYSNAAQVPAAEPPAAPAAGAPNFADMVKTAAEDAIDTMKSSEETAKAGIAGKASLRDVVLAANNAELTLETVVTMRDKMVSAYNEIMKMPI